MKKLSLSALAAVGVLAGMTGANAADLGGNCCADLEERIAELEATTVRKGNRKVSLTVSGWVSQQVLYFDDGVEKNAYVSDIGSTLNSNFKLSGSAKITPDLSAGYLMQVEVIGNENLGLSQNVSANGKKLDVIQSFWFLKSESLGKLSVGTQSSAADNAALLPDGSGSLIFANYIMYDINSFSTRRAGVIGTNNTNWGSLATCQSFGGSLPRCSNRANCVVSHCARRWTKMRFSSCSPVSGLDEPSAGGSSRQPAVRLPSTAAFNTDCR